MKLEGLKRTFKIDGKFKWWIFSDENDKIVYIYGTNFIKKKEEEKDGD